MATLLIVDDEASILLAFRKAFREPAVTVLTAETAVQGLDIARQRHPDVIVLDVHLPDMSGLEMLRRLRALDARSPVIFITGKSTTDTAIEAMKLGAYEYLLKPLELSTLRQVIDRALAISRLMHVPAVLAADDDVDERADAIVGVCPAMQDVYKAIGRVAAQDVTVLITGASGTGKELVARALYQHSRRANGPFLPINCAAIPEQLLESELFGHEKGTFTGADRRRIGKFEQCSGGTLFLDEVGILSPLTQSKLLRVLQEQTFERLGGDETIRTDVRVLAATNTNLQTDVAAGRFRLDLFYRLSVFTIALPSLRMRGDDLKLLVSHYLRRFNRELGKDVRDVAPEALELLRRYPWPGNVRELQSVLKQALLQAAGPILLADFLPSSVTHSAPSKAGASGSQEGAPCEAGLEQFVEARLHAGTQELYAEALERLERLLLTRVLRHTGGNQLQAAKVLGITRGSLRTKIRDLGIHIDRTIHGGEEQEV
ncbi:MAG TPA: sigma-54 dependent transcriptional regulator [Gemmataceae bacterium]|jgi:two-component system nitrogen regulation response regulator GlnG